MFLQITNNSMLDKGIAITIVLFILSMISERFVNWIKLNFGKEGKKLWGFSTKDEDLTTKKDDPEEEKYREQQILGLNIVVGIIIAFLAHANLFSIIGGNLQPYQELGWNRFNWNNFIHLPHPIIRILGSIIGISLCGFFISLGSKFWHDLLDVLLYSNNLKQKISENETYHLDKIEDLDNWIKVTQSDISKKVLDENITWLKNLKNVIAVGAYINEDNNSIIQVLINDNDDHLIPTYLPYLMSGNKSFPVPVVVIKTNNFIAQVGLNPSAKIINSNNPVTQYGSFGCRVCFMNDPKQEPLLLSCYHVLKGPNHSFDNFEIINEEQISFSNQAIGKIVKGVRDSEIDAAIMKPNPNTNLSNMLSGIGPITSARQLDVNDIKNKTEVYVQGATSTIGKKGRLKFLGQCVNIYYDKNRPESVHSFYNLMLISDDQGNAISEPGDSGTAVIDVSGNILGLVVGGNTHYTLMIPIVTILNRLNIKID